MSKLLLVAVSLFVVAMVLPELRALLFVGGFGLIVGFMVGMQQKTRHDTEVSYNRLLRGVRSIEA